MRWFDAPDPSWIETTDDFDDRREWVAVDSKALNGHRSVSMSRICEWQDGRLAVDPEAGLTFDVEHVDALIAALQKARTGNAK